ncbi:MAG: Uncharacterized protein FD122_204 [Stygiobacter sp.]|nr:MAG: Uncharacterized protein FD122_204 [Stygiobacter sp.]KAF0217701.1 MAG: hypothetical protein FD178_513 [Ignavibacteria bacterium]
MKDPLKIIAENMLRDGLLDISNKSDEEILVEIKNIFTNHLKNSGEIEFSIDHRKGLLSQARKFRKEKNLFYSNVFYSLFIEHWFNNIVFVSIRRKQFNTAYVNDIIRNTNIKSKMTWLLELFGLEPIPEKHFDVISKLFENRNSFVHYKWKSFNLRKNDFSENSIKQLTDLEQVEKTVKYLQNYENRKIFNSKKSVARKF